MTWATIADVFGSLFVALCGWLALVLWMAL